MPEETTLESSRLNRIFPLKNPSLWTGIGVGVGLCVLVIAVLVYSLMHGRMWTERSYEMANREALAKGGGQVAYLRSSIDVRGTMPSEGTRIVQSAELDMVVANCAQTRKKIEEIAVTESGFLQSSVLEQNWAKISLRVPAARFAGVRSTLRHLALSVRQDTVSEADVSQPYVDLEAQLASLRAEEQQFLEIMKKAHSVPDVLAVTKELSGVRGQIQWKEAEYRRLKARVDMAEINLFLWQASGDGEWAPGASIRSAWTSLLRSLTNLADFLIWLLVNLPLLVLWGLTIALLAAAGWYVLRKGFRVVRAIFGKKNPAAQAPAS
jgi:hypothetical protein